ASVGVDGIQPTRPVENRVRLTPRVERVDRCFAGPRFARRDGGDFLGGFKRNRGAPFDLADENEIQRRIVSGTVPLGAASRAGTEMDTLAYGQLHGLLLHP